MAGWVNSAGEASKPRFKREGAPKHHNGMSRSSPDRVPDAQSMPSARHAKVPQSLPEKVHGFEGVRILAKPDRLKPLSDLAHALSCSNSALASFKSSVSKPSVNQL